jgi:hypothetical protein
MVVIRGDVELNGKDGVKEKEDGLDSDEAVCGYLFPCVGYGNSDTCGKMGSKERMVDDRHESYMNQH